LADATSFALGVVLGAAVAFVPWVVLRAKRSRSSRRDPTPLGPSAQGIQVRPDFDGGRTPSLDAAESESIPPTSLAAPVPDGFLDQDSGGRGDSPSTAEVLLSERIVLHLDRQGRLGPDDVARPGHTQRGMVQALGSPQSTISRALKGLLLTNVIEAQRRHVPGEMRRVLVYTLTAQGESLARELRPPPSTNPPRRAVHSAVVDQWLRPPRTRS
jgi:hypothetical protein